MTWPGGPCPKCGEEMPGAMAFCRYCRTVLSSDHSGNPVAAPVVGPDAIRQAFPDRAVPLPIPLPRDTQEQSSESEERSSDLVRAKPKRRLNRRKEEQRPAEHPACREPLESSQSLSSGMWLRDGGASPARRSADADVCGYGDGRAGASAQLRWNEASLVFSGIVILLLLAPLCVSGPVAGASTRLSLTWPMIHSGDEPHHLVLISSVVRDGDLNVANNYMNVHAGGNDAGKKFAGASLDHHVVWYFHGRFTRWWELYETDENRWNRDAEGHPVPTRKKNFQKRAIPDQEYSRHSPGLALLLSPFLFVFRSSDHLESAALAATALVTVAGFLAFCGFVRPYVNTPNQAVLFAAIAYLGSPLWHYGRTLYAEPYVATLLICACMAVLRSCRYLVGGLCLGAATLLKTESLIFAIPLLAEPLWRRDRLDAACLGFPVLAAACLRLLWNYQLRGGWTQSGEMWEWGHPVHGIAGLLCGYSVNPGLLLVSPVLFLSPGCLKPWWSRHRKEALLVLLSAGCFVLFAASQLEWWGGTCYSARLLVPVLPLIFLPLALIVHTPLWSTRSIGLVVFLVAAIGSVSFGLIAAFACEHVHGKHPLWVFS